MARQAIVLAAGRGTRMKSDLPKVLFPACGRPMIRWVIDALRRADVENIALVVGYRADLVEKELADQSGLHFVKQEPQLGTGHAVMVCRPWLAEQSGRTLVVAGDSPLIQTDSIETLFQHAEQHETACLLGTLRKENPHGLGRILRDDEGEFAGIVEEKDATDAQRQVTEVNMSTYVFECRQLERSLSKLTNDNKQNEYYLTDCPGILKREGARIDALPILKPCESLSVNTVEELALVEDEMRRLGYGES